MNFSPMSWFNCQYYKELLTREFFLNIPLLTNKLKVVLFGVDSIH